MQLSGQRGDGDNAPPKLSHASPQVPDRPLHSSTVADLLGHDPSSLLVSRTMRVASLIATLGGNHHWHICPPPASSQNEATQRVNDPSPPSSRPTCQTSTCSYPPASESMCIPMTWEVDDPAAPLISPQCRASISPYPPASVSTRNATNRWVYNPPPLLPATIHHESTSSNPPLVNSHQSPPRSNECVSI